MEEADLYLIRASGPNAVKRRLSRAWLHSVCRSRSLSRIGQALPINRRDLIYEQMRSGDCAQMDGGSFNGGRGRARRSGSLGPLSNALRYLWTRLGCRVIVEHHFHLESFPPALEQRIPPLPFVTSLDCYCQSKIGHLAYTS